MPVVQSVLTKRRYQEILSLLQETFDDTSGIERFVSEFKKIMRFDPEVKTYTKEKGRAYIEARKKRAEELGVSLWVYGGGKASYDRKNAATPSA